MVAHTCIPALWEAKAGGSLEVRSSRPAWPTRRNSISTKNTKISQVWCQAPVIPASREAEARESPEPRRQRLQRAEMAPLHSSLGDRMRLCLKKKKESKKGRKKENGRERERVRGQVQWLMPVIPALWMVGAGRSLKVRGL